MKIFYLVVSIFIFNSANAQVTDFNSTDFTNADKIAKLNRGDNLQNLSLLSYNLTADLPTEAEKFRAIYIWVCTNISSDYNQYRKVIKKVKKFKDDSLALLEWNNKYKKVAFKKLLKHKKTMCTGYAYLIKELSFLADIECEIIDGYGRTVESNVDSLEIKNHSWNAVKLDNKWYLCDATWSSGYIKENNSFVKDYNDGYFLTSPILFSKNHYPADKKWLLTNKTTRSSFASAPLVYGEAFKLELFPFSPTTMKTEVQKNEEVNFSFKTPNDIPLDKISLVTYSGNTENTLHIYDIKKSDGLITLKNKFKNKGLYDVHLKIDDEIVTTYSINVIKD